MRRRKYKIPKRRYKPVTYRSKLKKERLGRLGKYFMYTAVIFAGLFTLYFILGKSYTYFTTSNSFKIRKIEVVGTQNVTKSEIVALLPFRTGDNIFKVWLSKAQENIIECKPELKKISISRRWQKIYIKLKEREPIACINIKGTLMGLDEDNIPFPLKGTLSEYLSGGLPEISVNSEPERIDVLGFIKELSEEDASMLSRVRLFTFNKTDDLVFEFKDSSKIVWGKQSKSSVEDKITRLNQVLEDCKKRFSKIEYISLCYFDDGRILVKPR